MRFYSFSLLKKRKYAAYLQLCYYNLCGTGSQHSNISKGKRGGGVHIKKSLVCTTAMVKVDRNKNVTLNRRPYGSYE